MSWRDVPVRGAGGGKRSPAEGWIAIRVSLRGGGGIACDPPPGRIMLVAPEHTFADLAEAIDTAFARWDRSHLHMFELADRREVVPDADEWDGDGMTDEAELDVSATVGLGERFLYRFDLGDNWEHDCEVVEVDVDPLEVYGMEPELPVPIWGWGWIPDQYGRRTEDDTGEDEPEE